MQMLYCYVDGSDNHTIEPLLIDAFSALVANWAPYRAVLVNDQQAHTLQMGHDDLSDWFIGLNLPLNQVGPLQITQLIACAKGLAGATGRDFVVGITLKSGLSEDLLFLDENACEADGQRLLTMLEGEGHGA
ncbi:hypothetical protein [Pseudomonas fluorescens]|nr:hypothetical protein [Pseudomonas fluorescens]